MKNSLLATAAMSLVLFGAVSPATADMIIYNAGSSDVNTAGSYTNSTPVEAITVDGDQATLINTSTINDGTNAAGQDVVSVLGGVTLDTLNNSGSISNGAGGFNPLQIDGTINNLINSGTIATNNTNGAAILLSGQIGSLDNTGGIIESTVNARALWINAAQNNALTNSGTIRNTNGANASSSDAVRVSVSQTQLFTNTGTISGSNDAIEVTDDANFLFENQGTVTGTSNYGVNIDGNSAVTITNSGSITGGLGSIAIVDAAGTGKLVLVNKTGGILNGNVDIRSNAAHEIDLQGGTVSGNILLDGVTGNTFKMADGASTGSVQLGSGAVHSVTVTGGTVTGYFDVGTTGGTTINVNPSTGVVASFLNAGSNAIRGNQVTVQMNGAGTLRINGNVTDTAGGNRDNLLDINSGTLEFTGNSTIQGGIDSDGATISLGLNKVTIGNVTDISGDSIISLELNGANTGSLVNGAIDAAISIQNNATITLAAVTGVSQGDTFTIIDATGAGGGANLTVDTSMITVTDSVGELDFTIQKVGDLLQLVAVASTAGLTNNAIQVQQVSSTAFAGDATLSAALSGLSGDARNEALESLGNYSRTAAVRGAIQSQTAQSNIVTQRLNVRMNRTAETGISTGDEAAAAVRNFWAQGVYFQGSQDDEEGLDGYEARSAGLAFGMDRSSPSDYFDELLFGFSGAYSHTTSDMNNKNAETDIDTYLLATYAAAEKGPYLFQGQMAFGFSQFDSSRHVNVAAVDRVAQADFNGYQFGLNLQASRLLKSGALKIEPALSLNYGALYTEDYKESGALSANLMVDDEFSQQLSAGTSIALSGDLNKGGYIITPRIEVGYSYELLDEDLESTQRFEGGGASFTTSGLKPSRHSGFIGGDLTILSVNDLEFSLGYRYGIREGFESHNADAKLTVPF